MRFNRARVMKRAWKAFRSLRTNFVTFAAALKWSWSVERRELYPFEVATTHGHTRGIFSDGTFLIRSRQGELLNTGGLAFKWHREAKKHGKNYHQQRCGWTAGRVA